MNIEKIRSIIESVIFSSEGPVTLDMMATAVEEVDKQELQVLVENLAVEWRGMNRAFHLVEVAGGWQFRTKPEYGAWLQRMHHDRPTKLSKPSLETLAVIAYKQPITRPEIEDLRGVDSGAVVKNLLERNLIRIIGKKDAPGKPMVYGTSTRFLEVFSLRDLGSLPSLRDLKELDEDGGQQLTLPAAEGEAPAEGAEPAIPVSINDSERRKQIRDSVRGMLGLPMKPDEPLTVEGTEGLPQTDEEEESALAELEAALKRRKEASERSESIFEDAAEKDYVEKITNPVVLDETPLESAVQIPALENKEGKE